MPFEFMQVPANGQGGLMRCESPVDHDSRVTSDCLGTHFMKCEALHDPLVARTGSEVAPWRWVGITESARAWLEFFPRTRRLLGTHVINITAWIGRTNVRWGEWPAGA